MIKKERTLYQYIKLLVYIFYTKCVCRSARLLRFPLYIRGKKYINFGKNLTTGIGCRFDVFKLNGYPNPELIFGENIQLNDYVHICSIQKIEIGDDTLIASHVYISDNSHGTYKGNESDSSPFTSPIKRIYQMSSVKIGKRVWIGEGCMILPGVSIGDGAVIGAHAVVNRDIPANTIAVGSPAIIVKRYNLTTQRWEKTNHDGSFIENKK